MAELLLKDFLKAKYGELIPDRLIYFVQCPHCYLSTWWVTDVFNKCDRCCKDITEDWNVLGSGYVTTAELFWENKTKPFQVCKIV